MRIKKGDIVKIISGKDRGKQGKVLRAFPKSEKIVVEGVALRKKHRRPRRQGQKGEVVTLPSPIHVSNTMLFCTNCGCGVRAGLQILENGRKARVCKKCKNEI
ncbi:MAG: 50S ribosomal protein L24 [Candidatus Giovannonibacteria bacterium]|nr:MAG: 50S ribosomal protein L24 [Candidatus Giovannonibacteria bacterium]